MSEEEYVAKCEELLSKELPVESPDELMKAAVEVESLGYLATKFQARAEKELRQADVELMQERRLTISLRGRLLQNARRK